MADIDLDMLISPLTWTCLALCAAALLVWRDRGGAGRARPRRLLALCALAAVTGFAAMTPAVANLLAGWLERPSIPDAACVRDTPPVAVVLGGGVSTAPAGVDDIGSLSMSTRRRVERAVQWWIAAPGRRLVLTGGPIGWDDVPEAAVMEAYAQRLGVRPDAIRVERASLSTWGNARNVAAMQPAVPRRVALVTSAMHMPRARDAMRHAGFAVCEVPADRLAVPFDLPGGLLPQSGALSKTEAALHELVGQGYYAVLAACTPRSGGSGAPAPLCRLVSGKQ